MSVRRLVAALRPDRRQERCEQGVGEIGQVGVAAVIANAVFHGTGRRFRELPIAVELVMATR
jgi:CO/xanthine dehydrogenase Mo-binding subunit